MPVIVAIRSRHNSGTKPMRARKPVWGTRYGTDINVTKSRTRMPKRIFCFFISIQDNFIMHRTKI